MLALLELVVAFGACVALAYFVGLKIYFGVGILVTVLVLLVFLASGLKVGDIVEHQQLKIPDASPADRALGALISILIAGGLGAIWPAIPIIVVIGHKREARFNQAVDRARSANVARGRADTGHDRDSPADDTSRGPS